MFQLISLYIRALLEGISASTLSARYVNSQSQSESESQSENRTANAKANSNPNPNRNPDANNQTQLPNPPAASALGVLLVPVPSSISSPFSDLFPFAFFPPPTLHTQSSIHSRKMDHKIPISDVKRNCLIIVNQWNVASGRLSRLVSSCRDTSRSSSVTIAKEFRDQQNLTSSLLLFPILDNKFRAVPGWTGRPVPMPERVKIDHIS